MRWPRILLVAPAWAVLFSWCASAAAGEEKTDPPAADVLASALAGPATPDLVRQVAAGDPAAHALAERLAQDPPATAKVLARLADRAARLVGRDGEAILAFADWFVAVADRIQQAAPEDPAVIRAVAVAYVVRVQIGAALGRGKPPEPWIRAAETLLAEATLGAGEARVEPALRALALLHEGARQEGASVRRLLDEASRIGADLVAAHPEAESVRRTVADQYRTKARLLADVSARWAQTALGSYFETFEPIARREHASPEDALAWNETLTFARERDIDLRVEYVTSTRKMAQGLLSVDLPCTGRWVVEGNDILERDVRPDVFRDRIIAVRVFLRDHTYGYKGMVRDAGGDTVKGVGNIGFIQMEEGESVFRKVHRRRKPARRRFNEKLPSGSAYELEGSSKTKGTPLRITGFLVKAVKVETTLGITIWQLGETADKDAELDALLASFDIVPKKRR